MTTPSTRGRGIGLTTRPADAKPLGSAGFGGCIRLAFFDALASVNDGRASDELRWSVLAPRPDLWPEACNHRRADAREARCFPANRVACGASALPDSRSARPAIAEADRRGYEAHL